MKKRPTGAGRPAGIRCSQRQERQGRSLDHEEAGVRLIGADEDGACPGSFLEQERLAALKDAHGGQPPCGRHASPLE
jgi:hypothetical protein